jgi:branched-chain amino acid transport system permease protein
MFIGCALAGIAAALMAPLYYVDPWIGLTPLIMALLAIVIGGLGSVLGAVVGGALLGFSGTFLIYYLGPWSELAAFVIVIAVLLFRPEGIFGRPKA